MQTIKNGRKRGCGSCGQSESHESLQLNQPVITGSYGGQFRATVSIHHPTGRDIRQVRSMAELSMDQKLAA
jgi:hypothetical protein